MWRLASPVSRGGLPAPFGLPPLTCICISLFTFCPCSECILFHLFWTVSPTDKGVCTRLSHEPTASIRPISLVSTRQYSYAANPLCSLTLPCSFFPFTDSFSLPSYLFPYYTEYLGCSVTPDAGGLSPVLLALSLSRYNPQLPWLFLFT